MSEYVSRVILDMGGQSIEDFKSVTEKQVELRKQVNLMRRTGFMKVTPRYQVEVEYVVPTDRAEEFDFHDSYWEGTTLTVEYENGRRITFLDVCVLTVGDLKYDAENEATRTITLGAGDRQEE